MSRLPFFIAFGVLMLGPVAGAKAQPVVPPVGPTAAPAMAPPTFFRMRPGADDWMARGAPAYGIGIGYPGFGFGYTFIAPPTSGASWVRPYPYHFDYYRYRWGAESAVPAPFQCPPATEPLSPSVSESPPAS